MYGHALHGDGDRGLVRLKKFRTVALSFLFNKYYPIIEQLGLKDSSCDLQTNYTINFYFHLYLMLRTCHARFDVTPKTFQDSPSYRILLHIHEALNINENKKLIIQLACKS